jgi:hypothetical protein
MCPYKACHYVWNFWHAPERDIPCASSIKFTQQPNPATNPSNTKLLETKHYNSSTLHMFQCLQHSHFVASWLGKIKIPAQSLLMDSNCQEALQNKNLTKASESIWIKKWRICCCTILFTNAMNHQQNGSKCNNLLLLQSFWHQWLLDCSLMFVQGGHRKLKEGCNSRLEKLVRELHPKNSNQIQITKL